MYIHIYIHIHTYRLDSSFIFIHDIYQVVQDFAQQKGKTRCCKIGRQNAEHIYRLVFPGASYSLPYLEGKHYADVFSPLQHWYRIMIDGYVEFVNLRPNRAPSVVMGAGKSPMCRSSWPKCACLHLKRSRAIGFAGKG